MTTEEFDRWFLAHCGAFGGMKKWATDNPDAVEAFAECLHDVDFNDARQATREMNRGEYEAPAFGDHARAVRRLARTLAFEAEQRNRKAMPLNANGPRYNCKWCRDGGIVMVADIYVRESGKAPIRAYLEGLITHLPECGVFCFCGKGRSRHPQFDERYMFPVTLSGSTEDDAIEFNDWWSHGGFKTNRIGLFDEHNAGTLA